MDMSAFGDRIKLARKHARLSQVKLCKAVGIAQGTLSEMENSGSSSTFTVQIAKACGVSPEWLATGEGEMSPSSHAQTLNVTSYEDGCRVPLLSWQEAGQYQGVLEVFDMGETREWVNVEAGIAPPIFAMRVTGNSMVSQSGRSFPAGTIIFVDPQARCESGDFVVAREPVNHSATFRQLVNDGGRWFLSPLNSMYRAEEVSGTDVVIGRVFRSRTEEDL